MVQAPASRPPIARDPARDRGRTGPTRGLSHGFDEPDPQPDVRARRDDADASERAADGGHRICVADADRPAASGHRSVDRGARSGCARGRGGRGDGPDDHARGADLPGAGLDDVQGLAGRARPAQRCADRRVPHDPASARERGALPRARGGRCDHDRPARDDRARRQPGRRDRGCQRGTDHGAARLGRGGQGHDLDRLVSRDRGRAAEGRGLGAGASRGCERYRACASQVDIEGSRSRGSTTFRSGVSNAQD